ncbi:MAG TPA: type III-B CRISPR module RAMP protein Cmr1 [Myxococcota bacterium]|nr:type III-B CRISPR module RAMP protein Cmr1 [Myxococcota bacterium]
MSWTGKLTLLTPLYKGGANPEKADPNVPFRGPSIRGQLRFWWRATSEITDLEQLRAAERELFGGVFGEKGDNHQKRPVASKVRVGVTDQKSDIVPKSLATQGKTDLDYILWVVDKNNITKTTFHQSTGASGSLQISGPANHKLSLHKALVAFLLCGGLGSRSRRGLGSVWLESENVGIPATGFASEQDFLAKIKELIPQHSGPRKWPTLSGARLILGRPVGTALDALVRLSVAMQGVRSSFKNKNRPIQFQKTWASVAAGNGADVGYTAALGMPVPYHSKDSKRFSKERTLNCKVPPGRGNADRYPSPILFRTIKLKDNRFLPVMVVLQTPTPAKVSLNGERKSELATGDFRPEGLEVFIKALDPAAWKVHPLGATP